MATNELPDDAVPRRRGAGKVKIVLVSLLLLFAATFFVVWLVSAWRLEAQLDTIRAAGEPLTAADLEEFYAKPAEERDATNLWLDAFAALQSEAYQSDAKPLPHVGEGDAAPLPGELWPQLDAAEAFVTKYREPLEKIHMAAEMGGEARYQTKFSDGINMSLPHLHMLLCASHLLELESEIRAHRNDPHAAAQSVRAIFAVVRSLEREPLSISQLTRMGINFTACSRLQRLLPVCAFSEQELLQFDRNLARVAEAAAFRRALLGDRVIGIGQLETEVLVQTGLPIAPDFDPDDVALINWGPRRNIDELAYLDVTGKYISAFQMQELPPRHAVKKMQAEISAVTRSSGARWRCPFTRLLTVGLRGYPDAVFRAHALKTAARTAIAIERYRRVRGAPPKTLDQLVPDFLEQPPVDPIDGAALRYHSDSKGYKVYSIGPDEIDQGGEAKHMLDTVFEIRLRGRNHG